MRVEVDVTHGEVRLVEPHVLVELVVTAIGAAAPEHVWTVLEEEDAGRALTEDRTAAWIETDWVRAAAMGHVEDSWPTRFDAWLGERRAAGEVSADGTAVRAPISYLDAPGI